MAGRSGQIQWYLKAHFNEFNGFFMLLIFLNIFHAFSLIMNNFFSIFDINKFNHFFIHEETIKCD